MDCSFEKLAAPREHFVPGPTRPDQIEAELLDQFSGHANRRVLSERVDWVVVVVKVSNDLDRQ